MIVYADSSFVTSLCSADGNAKRAFRTLAALNESLRISRLTILEVQNALQLMQFHGSVSGAESTKAADAFQNDLGRGLFRMAPISSSVWELAIRLSLEHTAIIGTRSMDILHVATAAELHAICSSPSISASGNLRSRQGCASNFND